MKVNGIVFLQFRTLLYITMYTFLKLMSSSSVDLLPAPSCSCSRSSPSSLCCSSAAPRALALAPGQSFRLDRFLLIANLLMDAIKYWVVVLGRCTGAIPGRGKLVHVGVIAHHLRMPDTASVAASSCFCNSGCKAAFDGTGVSSLNRHGLKTTHGQHSDRTS